MTSPAYDIIVIGAGAIGCSAAWHARSLGAKKVLLIDRGGIAEGTSSQSSSILRTHYSVRENVELARRSWSVFTKFGEYLDDPQAECGLNRCGYLVVAADDERGEAVRASLAQQRTMGIEANEIDAKQAREILPLLNTDGLAIFGHEPEAGYADAYLTATAFARAARRLGVEVRQGEAVESLITEGSRVTGIRTKAGTYTAAMVICVANVWTNRLIESSIGVSIPLVAERHEVVAFEAPQPYLPSYPVLKDMASESMVYARCYGRSQLLASPGLVGHATDPDERQADVPLDIIATLGEQVAARLSSFDQAGVASTWTGLYDVTPDWNPVLGPLPGWQGLQVGFGFSGHGFKLSPAIGRLLAQSALGLPTEVPLAPYRYERFDEGALLIGRYGKGAVS
ncbi:MAG: FAD-binding oxidoreductase [Burkholderiales bacterium]|jgi:glycine/D-amino acid oxidase-like deaminating enzyme|nr:FAD-binding oxidoreductase [Burkholderiales bacterium]